MKKLLLPLCAFALLATSCAPDRAKLKKTFVDSCVTSAKKEMASNMPAIQGMDALIDEYCNCSGDKVLNSLTDEELKALDKNPNTLSQARLMEITQPCLEDFTQKVQAKLVQ